MMNMLLFEMKKVFSKPKSKVIIGILLIVLIATSILTINKVEYVDENGNHSVGFSAARNLREAKNEWSGYLTEDVFKDVLAVNKKINNSEEALSKDIEEQDKAYAKKQGISSILDVINYAFSGYRDYNYYAADNVSNEEVTSIYSNRISVFKNWLDSGEETFTENEKNFLIQQYENLETPFYYEYADGWAALLQNMSTFILILALLIGFFVAGIFSDEFQTKADSVFFSSKYGRTKGSLSKIKAGFCITSVFYVTFLALYTIIVLLILGADGANCPIQLDLWRSVYNITFFQAYVFIAVGGYIGTVFASTLAMLVSAITRSTSAAIVMPFIILCAFPFLSRIIPLPEICSFFPDQLLEIYLDIKESGLVEIGGKVMTTATVIVPVYAAICLMLQPVLYRVYSKKEIK